MEVDTTTFLPAKTVSMAFAWWVNIWVMFRTLMAACTGSDKGVEGKAYWGCLAGMSSMWTICRAYVNNCSHWNYA